MSEQRSPNRTILLILGTVIVLALLQKVLRPTLHQSQKHPRTERVDPVQPRPDPGAGPSVDPASRDDRGLVREPTNIIYTRHARCRMGCRHIDADEIKEVLRSGTINWEKSDLRGDPDPKYAVEGDTHDGQRVRLIIAQSLRGSVVVTVIDLGEEWKCDCK
jgi:Domain of unknown function (DUF4258)